MKKSILKGILGFPVTPFNNDNSIDIISFKENMDFLIENGITTIFVACGAGEYNSITNLEYEKLLEVGSSYRDDKIKIFAGIGGNVQVAQEQILIAEKYNIDGFLMMPPYLISPSREGLKLYLENLIQATSLDVIIYHRDNCRVDIQLLNELSKYENLVGFKDGVGKIEEVLEYVHTFGDRFEWINGLPLAEVTMSAYYKMGFESYSSAISNYIPKISRLHFDAIINGDSEKEKHIYENFILPIHRIRTAEKGYAVALIKAGINIINPSTGLNVRGPISSVKDKHYQQLKEIVEAANIYVGKVSV
ncbi:5-dehydro-4-deoxyglucarate dehydratase [Lysinibacillus capsici]|uniref:5-dehydro-4-deoxyglucarate dehydratase n=1 Tax=Lysinibacillus capsici TaxID=2115968 RepID=UPI0032E37EA4